MTKLVDMTLTSFLNELASDSPAPGGGSMAALSGASAAALGGMVTRLTAGSKKEEYNNARPRMIELVGEFDHIKNALHDLIDEDTNAFNEIMVAFRLPKDTEDAKKFRTDKIQEAYKKAVYVPFNTAKYCLQIMQYLAELSEKGLMSAISDVGVAVHLAYAGVEGARLNVLINLTAIKDESFKREYHEEIEKLHVSAIELQKKGIVTVEKKI